MMKMKKAILKMTLGIMTLCLFAINTSAEGYSVPSDVDNIGDELSVQQQQRRVKFQKDRLNYIVKVAELDSEETAWLDKELKRYDDDRAAIWLEMREARGKVRSEAETMTDEQYTEALLKLVALDEKISATHQDLAKLLMKQFSPKKAYIIFGSLHNHKSRMARSVRSED